jgi:molecular chaperone HtpG
VIDKLIQKEENKVSKLSEDEEKKLKEVIEKVVDTQKFSVVMENMSENELPMSITQPEFMRRMKEMQQTGGMTMMGDMPDTYNMVVNKNHKIMSEVLETEDEEKQKQIVNQLKDLALLSQNLLKGKELTEFINRSVNIIK